MYISKKNPKIEKLEIINPIKFELLTEQIKIVSLFNIINNPNTKSKNQSDKYSIFLYFTIFPIICKSSYSNMFIYT